MNIQVAEQINPELSNLFSESTLGLYLDDNAGTIFAMGRVHFLAPGAQVAEHNPLALHVVLDGRLAGPRNWFGPGNHFTGSEEELRAVDLPARVWTLDMSRPMWMAATNRPARRALTHALIAADAAEAAATPPARLPDPETQCNVDHPEIRRRAARLRRATPASTAAAIFSYVQAMPYRFGTWQERASDTMERGSGMCTTKANLQVALMRAAGLEAGFVEIPMPISTLGTLMPRAWLSLMRAEVRHYFAAVKLGGRWHSADASYDDGSFKVYLEAVPEYAYLLPATLAEGKPFSPAMETQGADMFDIQVRPDIIAEMSKKSRFLPRHFEALNTVLDRARGTQRRWGEVALAQVGGDFGEVRA